MASPVGLGLHHQITIDLFYETQAAVAPFLYESYFQGFSLVFFVAL